MATVQASIRERTMIGAGWMILWRIATRILGFGSTLVLARVLVPEDFGLIAIASTYVAAFDALSIFGLQDAIIRSTEPNDNLLDTAYTLSVMRGLLNTLIIAATAPIAAHFFAEPRLIPVLLVLALFPALEGTENIGVVEFRRDFRFEKEFLLFLMPRLVSVVVTVAIALVFRSYWALVIGNLVLRMLRWVLTYWMHPYRPHFSLAAWHKLVSFSLWTWAATIADFGRERSWMIVLGRFLDTFQVGVFMVASEIGLLPITEIVAPICRALFSGFTAARNEAGNFAYAFRRTIGVISVPLLPAAIGMSAVASNVVDIALGPSWSTAGFVIALVAASAPFALVTSIGATAMVVTGHVRNNFVLNAVFAVIGVVVCLISAWYWGLWGVAIARALTTVLEGVAFAVVTGNAVGTRLADWVACVWRPTVATAAMGIVLWVTGQGWAPPTGEAWNIVLPHFIDAVLCGGGVYGASLLLLWIAAGEPEGGESFLLGLLRNAIGSGARKFLVKT